MDSESATDCLLLKFLVLEDGLQAAASPTVSLMRPWIYHLIICICTLIEFFSSAFPQEKGRNARTLLPTVAPFLKKKKTRWRHGEYPARDLYHPTSHFLYCWFTENVSLPLTEFHYTLRACLFWNCMHFSLDFHSSEAHYSSLMFVPTTLLFNWTFGLCLDSQMLVPSEFCIPKDQRTDSARLNRTVISNDTELVV